MGENLLEHLIVDTHVHVASNDRARYPVADTSELEGHWMTLRNTDTEQLLANMDRSGVGKAVLVQPGPMLSDNSYVTDSARLHPGRAVAVCVVDEFARDAEEKLHYWIRERGGSGLRLSSVPRGYRTEWMLDPRIEPLLREAERMAVPVCIQCRTDGLDNVEKAVLERFPNLVVALDHVSHPVLDDGPPYTGLQPVLDLARFPNLYVKVTTETLSAVTRQPTGPARFMERLVEHFGAGRLMWGSNSPRATEKYAVLADLARSAVASLSREDAGWVLGKTALKVYPALNAG